MKRENIIRRKSNPLMKLPENPLKQVEHYLKLPWIKRVLIYDMVSNKSQAFTELEAFTQQFGKHENSLQIIQAEVRDTSSGKEVWMTLGYQEISWPKVYIMHLPLLARPPFWKQRPDRVLGGNKETRYLHVGYRGGTSDYIITLSGKRYNQVLKVLARNYNYPATPVECPERVQAALLFTDSNRFECRHSQLFWRRINNPKKDSESLFEVLCPKSVQPVQST